MGGPSKYKKDRGRYVGVATFVQLAIEADDNHSTSKAATFAQVISAFLIEHLASRCILYQGNNIELVNYV